MSQWLCVQTHSTNGSYSERSTFAVICRKDLSWLSGRKMPLKSSDEGLGRERSRQRKSEVDTAWKESKDTIVSGRANQAEKKKGNRVGIPLTT